MAAQMFNTAEELSRAVADGRISKTTLEAITQTPTATLQAFLTGSEKDTYGVRTDLQPLSADETTRLSVLASQILQGFDIGDDERLRAILEGLTTQFHLTLENIALLAQLDSADLAVALRDPSSLPAERKYALALRLSYLTNAIERARP
ncbi:HTH domain-containing protein [Microbacterium sp. NPDC006705]|uniref:HTH domain-containing protein n=1 Tax=Microbacterium sp. NPDC006705 TaxID=3364181 RepID=UPI00384E2B3A